MCFAKPPKIEQPEPQRLENPFDDSTRNAQARATAIRKGNSLFSIAAGVGDETEGAVGFTGREGGTLAIGGGGGRSSSPANRAIGIGPRGSSTGAGGRDGQGGVVGRKPRHENQGGRK